MKHNYYLHRIALVVLAAMLITAGGPVTAFAAEDSPSAIEFDEESLVEPADCEDPAPAEETDEPTEPSSQEDVADPAADWDFDDDWDGPRSEDGAPLTREEYGTTAEIEKEVLEDGETDTAPVFFASLYAASSSTGTLSKSTCVNFKAYRSPYWYCNRYYTDGSHKYGHYFYAGTMAYHMINGGYAYCIEPNTASAAGQSYTSYSDSNAGKSSYWMYELDSTQRAHIKKILAFGYPQVDRGYSAQVQYAATQTLIWEVCVKLRYSNLQTTSDAGLFNNIKAVLGTNYSSCYNAILSDIASGISNGKLPSFSGNASSSAGTILLTHNKSAKTYEATVTDSNSVLQYFTFAADNVSFTRNGNNLTISVPESKINSVTGTIISATSTQKDMSTSNPTIWENSTYQTVVTGGGADSPVAYIQLDYTADAAIAATLNLVKRCTDSSITLRGWQFTVKNNATGATVTRKTDASGNISFTDLDAGSYTITEKTYNGYAVIPSQTITLNESQTSTVTFTNSTLKGTLVIRKSVNYGTTQGFHFRLHGTSTIGKAVDLTATTDSSGVATFSNVYIGNYTLEEVNPGDAYLTPASQTVVVTEDTKEVNFYNTRKMWKATVTKTDGETGSRQGNATLDGAEYTLYQNGTAIKTYTVQNGTFTTDEFPCTASDAVYTLKETKAPDGYTLSSTEYPLTTGYTHYSKASNTISLTVSDTVIKGKIQLQKYAWDQTADTKQPEAGAVFYVWLKSAGSYDQAAENVRDCITVDSDGKGTSKDLPYGTYCLKQKSGWDGYAIDDTVYEVAITQNGETVTKDTANQDLIINNRLTTGKLSILKKDGDTNEPLADAEFTLTGSDGSESSAKSDASGSCSFDGLSSGVTYTWQETKAPHGYLIGEENSGTCSVSSDQNELTLNVLNYRRPGSFSVLKQDTNGNPLAGCTFLLEYWNGSAWTPVSYRNHDTVTVGTCNSENLDSGCLTTGTDGTVTFTGLWADDEQEYRLTEVAAPEGYELLGKPVYEGVLPAVYDAARISETPDETINEKAYFYDMTFTVRDGKIYTLPMTGGHGNLLVIAAIVTILFGAWLCIVTIRPSWYVMLKRNMKNYF